MFTTYIFDSVKTSKAIENRNKVLENKKSIFDTLTTSKAIENMSKSLKKKSYIKQFNSEYINLNKLNSYLCTII